MFLNMLFIFIGSGLGGVARYLTSLGVSNVVSKNFPFGTMLVNVLGCVAIGTMVILIKHLLMSNVIIFIIQMRKFLMEDKSDTS